MCHMQEVVSTEQPAMKCNFCDPWEHVSCVRECDRVDHELYEVLMESHNKNICTCVPSVINWVPYLSASVN